MNALATAADPATLRPASDDSEPFLEVEGIEGSRLRATASGLTVLDDRTVSGASAHDGRFWDYGRIGDLRLEEYGSLGVVRARVRATGNELPLLLLDPQQITAARRVLEMVWNLMGSNMDRRIRA
jgi:hypothetical protein